MFIVSLIVLVIAVASAVGAFITASGTQCLQSLRERKYGFRYSHLPSPRGYQDQDGQSNSASLASFADRIPKILALLFIVADLVICLGRLLGIAGLPLSFLDAISRILTAAQLVSLFFTPSPIARFTIGCWAALSCFAGASGATYQIYQSTLVSKNGVSTVTVGDVVLLIFAAGSALSLPRRPAVAHDGRPVDAQYTVSALQRYSLSWAYNLLYKAKAEGRLEYEDLPSLHRAARTAPLLNGFSDLLNHTRWQSLWVKLFLAHKGLFCQQWALTVASSFALYAPQLCMLKILRLLEQRHEKDFSPSALWLWVTVLGFSKISQVTIESWMEWINWAMLSVPVRSQLAALIYQKSLRTKDIKGVKTAKTTEKNGDGGVELEDADEEGRLMEEWRKENTQKDQEDVEGEEENSSSQAIINLVGVDTVRISNFAAENNLFLSTVVNLALALSILFHLLGWLGVTAGLVMPILLTPLNLWATRKYSDAQDAVMTIRDERMALTGEALRGIRQIKFSAVEDKWQNMIFSIRDRELKQQWWVYVLVSGLLCIWMAAPLLFSTVSLAIHAWQNGSISPSTAFTSLAIFGTLEYALSVVPNLITEAVDANVSVQRIQKHLQRQERGIPETVGEHVTFNHVSVQWPSEDQDPRSFALRELDLRFPKGELSVICGKTGCGKTLLLASILGEADVIEGSIKLPERQDISDDEWIDQASVAYVAQIPWTENATIRDNILFGLPFIQKRYEQVIWACALERDIEIMPDGELTEVGANGINLSGGQRWRLTFARALYSRAATLVLDDIFSAVDPHVGRHLLQHALLGSLAAGRTRILATHHEELVLPATSYLVRLHETDGSSFATATSQKPKTVGGANTGKTQQKSMRHDGTTKASSDTSSTSSDDSQETGEAIPRPKPAKFVEEEVRERGHIKWQVYKAYMIAAGGFRFWALALSVFVLAQGTLLGRAWLVKVWTEQDLQASPNVDARAENTETNHDATTDGHLYFFLGGYLIISLIAAVLAGTKFVFFCSGSIEASRRLFDSFTQTVLRAPLRWLDTVPQGRILNRFAADFNSVDSKLARDVSHFWESGLIFLSIVIAGMFVSIYMLLPSALLSVICVYYTTQYLPGAREIKRLEATAQSPVFEHYSSTLTGLPTIRCFQKNDEYQQSMNDKLDEYARATWHLWLTQRWMSFRMGTIGAVFAFAVASVVASRTDIEAALAGFALSFSLQYSEAVVETIRRYSAMELDMNSTERIVEYTDMPTEDRTGHEPPATWPSHGRIQVEGLEAGYAPGLPSVLKGLTFEIEPGQRIGVVGRTGSGKSSFTLALFRFIEARSGRILIDGTDVATVGLQALRSRLSIIPQDPVLFSGTLRTNLDVFGQYDDEVLKQSLRDVHLLASRDVAGHGSRGASTGSSPKKALQGQQTFESLDSPVSEGGLSLSQGQRQLICLARAIITRPKIMVLDEATSAVDMSTDVLIQESIREQFKGSTLIVIAHRLSTIADFDKILVLDNGTVVEFDTPVKLLAKKNGEFRKMLNESGEREKLEKLIYKTSS